MASNKKVVPAKQGNYKVGHKRPPKANQFGQPNANPRHNGAWKKEDTPRYKLESMMKLSDIELQAVKDNIDAPLFERRLADNMLKGDWRTIREMVHEVYGTPKQMVDVTTGGDKLTTALVQFESSPKNG